MQTYKELIQNLELNEVNGNELKKWFGNMGVKVKASKVGSKFLNAKSDVEFPNEFRLHVVDKFFSLKDVKDKKNVNYGNIETKSITLTPAQWDDLLNESVENLDEFTFSDNLKGWIAIFNGKELEITLKDAGSLYDAKKFAIKALKVPKSKVGLLAIAPAY